MTTGSIGPGTVLAGRYRLDDLLTESAGARFWRATDLILARSVAIHAVPSTDDRAPGLLEASRVSATVTDPHLLRVLDCDDDGDITWVVNEWGDGISLDLMLQQGTLPPSRAAWLTREVAEAIAAGHAQGVAHGRLNPEAVLVTHAGAVKLIGYVVDASLEEPRPPDPLYGELDDREADVINLAGILYAALTGKWPGVARSAVPAAPREARRPLRPRQVRAGVPRTLDVICERVLHKEASQHAMPIETAHEIAAALADYIGDPTLSAPVDAAGMHVEPTVTNNRDSLPDAGPEVGRGIRRWIRRGNGPGHCPRAQRGPGGDPALPARCRSTRGHPDLPPPVRRPGLALAARPSHRDGPALGAVPRPPRAASVRQHRASRARRLAPAGGVLRLVPDRPGGLVSQRSGQQHRPPRARWRGRRRSRGRLGGRTGTPADFWPFDADPDRETETHTGKEGRGWLRTAVVVAVLLVLVVAMAVAFNRGRQDGNKPLWHRRHRPAALRRTQGSPPSRSPP